MTALEEIKKALEGVTPGPWESKIDARFYFSIFAGDFKIFTARDILADRGYANARYIAAVNPAAISEILSTLESLQHENEELRRDLSHEASHRQKLQNALAYWMPGVTEEIEISTNGRCGDDALLLVGSDGPFEDKCWGNEAIARAEAAEAEVKRLTESRDGYKRGRDSIQAEYDRLRASHSDEIEALTDKIEGLSADLDSAVGVAFTRGAHEWVRMNYPDRFEKLSSHALASTGGEHNAE